jgi:Apea-like HEPN/ApeA N-terminal domain 1
MLEPFEVFGRFAPPGADPGFGRLSFDPATGLQLTMVDADWAAADEHEWPLVLGEGALGGPVSLLGLRRRMLRKALAGSASAAEFEARQLLEGAHIEPDVDPAYTIASISTGGLREWLTGGWARLGSVVELSDKEWLEHEPSGPDIEVEDVLIRLRVSATGTKSRYEDVRRIEARAHFTSQEPLTIASWRRLWVRPLQHLLVFANREQSIAESIGFGDDQTRVRLIEQREAAIEPSTSFSFYQRDLLPALILDDVDELVRRWYALHRRLGEASEFFFGTINRGDLPRENRLLSLTSFAESYHRALHDDPPFSEAQHQEQMQAILGAMEKSAHPPYENPLKYANSQSQRQRLRWLFKRAATVDPGYEEIESELCHGLVTTRNYLTHLDEKEEGVLEGPELGHAMALLTMAIELNLLLDLTGDEELAGKCQALGYVWDDPLPIEGEEPIET